MLTARDYMTKVGRYLRRRGRPTPKAETDPTPETRFADLERRQPDDPGPDHPEPRPPLHGGKQ